MLTKFYSTNGGTGVGGGHTNSEEDRSKFPDDPGMEEGRIPDGGGPADGFINEEGHGSGKGFLNHVYKKATTKHPDANEDNEDAGKG